MITYIYVRCAFLFIFYQSPNFSKQDQAKSNNNLRKTRYNYMNENKFLWRNVLLLKKVHLSTRCELHRMTKLNP